MNDTEIEKLRPIVDGHLKNMKDAIVPQEVTLDYIMQLFAAHTQRVKIESEISLARKVLALSSNHRTQYIKGATQKRRLQILTNEMLKIIPDDGLFVTEQVDVTQPERGGEL